MSILIYGLFIYDTYNKDTKEHINAYEKYRYINIY